MKKIKTKSKIKIANFLFVVAIGLLLVMYFKTIMIFVYLAAGATSVGMVLKFIAEKERLKESLKELEEKNL